MRGRIPKGDRAIFSKTFSIPQIRYQFWQGENPGQAIGCIAIAGVESTREKYWAQIMSHIKNIDIQQQGIGKVRDKSRWLWEFKAGPTKIQEVNWSQIGGSRLDSREVYLDFHLKNNYNQGTLEEYFSTLFG